MVLVFGAPGKSCSASALSFAVSPPHEVSAEKRKACVRAGEHRGDVSRTHRVL